MNTNLRIGSISRSLVAVLCIGGGLGACTTQEASTGTGGKGGAAAGTGGAGGSVGSTETDGVTCPLPAKALITDFTYAPSDAGAATDFASFGDSTTLSGTEFVYPTGTGALTSDVTKNNWHISGTVGDYSGLGLVFFNCSRVNAAAYKGISFTISGSVPTGNMITMGVGTLNNSITAAWLNTHGETGKTSPGRCSPVSGTNQYDQPTCATATKVIPITATPTTQKIMWADFTGGKPESGVTPTDIISVSAYFPWAGAGSAPYAADIVIDDLSFIP